MHTKIAAVRDAADALLAAAQNCGAGEAVARVEIRLFPLGAYSPDPETGGDDASGEDGARIHSIPLIDDVTHLGQRRAVLVIVYRSNQLFFAAARDILRAARCWNLADESRYLAGTLDEEDTAQRLRCLLFDPIDAVAVRHRLLGGSAVHLRIPCTVRAQYATVQLGALTPIQQNNLTHIEAAMPSIATVSVREHVGTCEHCHGEAHVATALVRAIVGGRPLSREYVIDESEAEDEENDGSK